MQAKYKKLLTLLLASIYLLFVVWWLLLRIYSYSDDSRQLFAATYGIVALMGGVIGLIIAKRWGFLKSLIGKALVMFSLGLFAQEFGQLSYSYYIYYLHTDVPYPSWGDLGYFLSIPLYIVGTLYLARASGMSITLKSFKSRLQALLLPLLLLGATYYVFLVGHEIDLEHPLTTFLDFGYPFGEAVYLSLCLLTFLFTRKVLGGVMKSKVKLVLISLVFQYIADTTFLYQAKAGTWYAGGINDLMYLTAYTLMTYALLSFASINKTNN